MVRTIITPHRGWRLDVVVRPGACGFEQSVSVARMIKSKPKRELDEAALADFRSVMAAIRQGVGDDNQCWPWPKVWPETWGAKPTSFTISRDGQGYGQFGLPETQDHRQRSFIAHRLAYKYFNLHLDPTMEGDFAGGEWIGGDIGKKDVVRHSNSCVGYHCVNPFHLRVGSHAHNRLDAAVKRHASDALPDEAKAKSADIVSAFVNGSIDVRVLVKEFGVADWQIVRIIQEAGHGVDVLFHSFDQRSSD